MLGLEQYILRCSCVFHQPYEVYLHDILQGLTEENERTKKKTEPYKRT